MKIYTNEITEADLYAVASRVRKNDDHDFHIVDSLTHSSRRYARTIEMHGGALKGRYRNGGNIGASHSEYRAATWTAWGYFIARLFQIDPEARIGQYNGVEDFHNQVHQMYYQANTYYGDSKRNNYHDISFLDLVKERV